MFCQIPLEGSGCGQSPASPETALNSVKEMDLQVSGSVHEVKGESHACLRPLSLLHELGHCILTIGAQNSTH